MQIYQFKMGIRMQDNFIESSSMKNKKGEELVQDQIINIDNKKKSITDNQLELEKNIVNQEFNEGYIFISSNQNNGNSDDNKIDIDKDQLFALEKDIAIYSMLIMTLVGIIGLFLLPVPEDDIWF